MTVWRDAQEQGKRLCRQNQWKAVRVLGWGEKRPVLVAVDLGTGEPVAAVYVNEYDPDAVCRWLEQSSSKSKTLRQYPLFSQSHKVTYRVCYRNAGTGN